MIWLRLALRLGAALVLMLDAALLLGGRSPDEAYLLAFVSDQSGDEDIYVADARGQRPINITRHPRRDRAPAWSPAGLWLAFFSNRSGTDQVLRSRWDGSALLALTDNSARNSHDRAFAWSPDGERLLVENGILTLGTYLYWVRADGSDRLRLTTYRDAWGSDWSPDGESVVYHSDSGGDYDIYQMRLDGSEWRKLTHTRGSDWSPAWSPQGDQIAYVAFRDGDYELYIMQADGSDAHPLTDNARDDYNPRWSPDGAWLLFESGLGDGIDLYRIRPDGRDLQQLTDHPGADTQPEWSPDGRWIVFVSDRAGSADLYRMRADGSQVERLTDHPAAEREPAWSARFSRGHLPFLGLLAALALGWRVPNLAALLRRRADKR